MEYQKITNLLNITSNQPSNFRTKDWVEINDNSGGTYKANKQIKFKTTMLKSSVCDYSDAYILVKATITVADTSAAGAVANDTNKKVRLKHCAPFTNCISKINNTQIDNAKDIDTVMPMYNVIEYSNNYSKPSGSLWEYGKDISGVNNNGDIVNFNGADATDSFNSKARITGQTDNGGEIYNVEITVPLKYLSDFWRTLEMPLIDCEVNLILKWSTNCVIVSTNVANQGAIFIITETRFSVVVVTLSTHDNAKLLPQLKSGFKRRINWNKHLSKPELLAQNPNLNHLVEPSFQEINRLFILAFANDTQRKSNKRCFLPNTEIKDYNFMIDGKNFFDQLVNNDKITYEKLLLVNEMIILLVVY